MCLTRRLTAVPCLPPSCLLLKLLTFYEMERKACLSFDYSVDELLGVRPLFTIIIHIAVKPCYCVVIHSRIYMHPISTSDLLVPKDIGCLLPLDMQST